MLFADGFLGLVLVALWVFCVIDVITTPDSLVRNLPKLAWLGIVLVVPDLGSIAWLVAGRTWQAGPAPARTRTGRAYAEYDLPGRAVPADPDDDEKFLRQVRERADQQRSDYQTRRQAELDAEQRRLTERPDETS